MQYTVHKAKGNTYKIDVTLPKEKVNEAFAEALEHEKEHVKLDGFRPGKAPTDLIKEKIDKTQLRSHAINHLLSEVYSTLINENKYKPIVNPVFNLRTFDEDKDMDVEVVIVEKPDIKIGDYKTELQKIDLNEVNDKGEKTASSYEVVNKRLLDAIDKVVEVEVSDTLVDIEKDRMLSNLIDQTSKLGITIEQYLESQKKSVEQIQNEFANTAKQVLKSDFGLTEVGNLENISVSDDEINTTIAAVPDEKSREVLNRPEQRMYIKAVLKKSKTLDQLRKYTKDYASVNK